MRSSIPPRPRMWWCPEIGWLAWGGKRWSVKAANGLLEIAYQDTIRAIRAEAHAVKDTGDDFQVATTTKGVTMWSDRLSKWCLDSQSNNHVACLERRSRPYLEVGPETH